MTSFMTSECLFSEGVNTSQTFNLTAWQFSSQEYVFMHMNSLECAFVHWIPPITFFSPYEFEEILHTVGIMRRYQKISSFVSMTYVTSSLKKRNPMFHNCEPVANEEC